ncbi:MAG: PEP/pyruvate-binding domain-containing protein [Actinomycetia bacterium]|nr:PEP/pyruvate-binding domain-containing protein [Actinomycetes bacterium]
MSKADGLRRLGLVGARVPPWTVVQAGAGEAEVLAAFDAVAGDGLVAVRSCAAAEDGSLASYAGQFASYLDVRRDQVVDRVRAVADSYRADAPGVYGEQLGVAADPAGEPVVLVQRMVPAVLSGVAFSVNPAGIRSEAVVSVGPGAGAVVQGESATTYHVSTVDQQGYRSGPDVLAPGQLGEVLDLLRRAHDRYGPVDLEVAVDADGLLWALQARPVTSLAAREPARHSAPAGTAAGMPAGSGPATGRGRGCARPGAGHRSWTAATKRSPAGPSDQPVTLDSSNIVESYPGLSLPLTTSFVPRAYQGVFSSLALRLTGDPALVRRLAPVLGRMVEPCSGRLYYRIDHWYQVLALMPLSRQYTRVWQRALGVEDRDHEVRPLLGRLRRLAVVVRLLAALRATPRLVDELHEQVQQTRLDLSGGLDDLRRAFEQLERRVLQHWDVTLLNDVRAFVFPALLSGWLGMTGRRSRAQELISQIAGIESLRPVRALQRLAATAPDALDGIDDDQAVAAFLAGDDPYAAQLRAYLDEFGDRYLEELKLESPTFRTHPLLLVEALRRLPRAAAPGPGRPAEPVRGLVGYLARQATAAIAARELSRLDRARVYGLVRAVALRAGELHAAAGHLETATDVWWLTLEELFTAADHREQVRARQADYAGFARLPGYRRLVFTGEPFDIHPAPGAVPFRLPTEPHSSGPASTQPAATGRTSPGLPAALHEEPGGVPAPGAAADRPTSRRGTGVSGGVATGPVQVVHDPRQPFQPGCVLVARTTDPGWVFLLVSASAVVVERGSLLSHTAIIARELGVPVVVGVPDATGWLRDGVEVEVDGRRGLVRIR